MFLANCKASHKMLHLPSVSNLMCALAMSQPVYTQITQASLMCTYIQSFGRRALKQVFWLMKKSVLYGFCGRMIWLLSLKKKLVHQKKWVQNSHLWDWIPTNNAGLMYFNLQTDSGSPVFSWWQCYMEKCKPTFKLL